MTLNFRLRARAAVLTAALFFTTLSAALAAPRNIIFLIGDGMGPEHVLAGQVRKVGQEGRLAIHGLPVHTRVTTDNVGGSTTDSAASATALSTGVKTHNGMIGLDADGNVVRTIFEALRDEGMAVGLVTTVTLSHATPAGFSAHVRSRGNEPRIAEQQVYSGADVLIGGGWENFVPNSETDSKRPDELDLLAAARSRGYQVVQTAEEFRNSSDTRILALLQAGALTTHDPEPSLAELTAKAIRVLKGTGKNYFLMVEGGQIDWGGHANDIEQVVDQMVKFDEAIAVAADFAREDGQTLVLVTADHETGGLKITPKGGNKFDHSFSTKGHTSTPVDLYAFGPDAEEFASAKDNTDIPKTIAKLMGVEIGNRGRMASTQATR